MNIKRIRHPEYDLGYESGHVEGRRIGTKAERDRIVALFKDPPEDWLRAAREVRTTIDANWNTRAILSALAEIIAEQGSRKENEPKID